MANQFIGPTFFSSRLHDGNWRLYISLAMLKIGLSPWVALLLGVFCSMFFAFLIAVPFTRLRGIYFSIASLFLTAMAVTIAQQWRELTGGPFRSI